MNSLLVAGNGIPTPVLQQETRKQPVRPSAATEAAIKRFEAAMPDGKNTSAEAAAAHLERISSAFNKKLQFVVNHDSHEITIKVIDRDTDKVIKILPPEELQRLNRRLKEDLGFLFDEKV
ncbi:hypothetical protein FACS1894190_06930 [Spirochaetia bacterium]|nr:hypothetical protein FACS1894190_06930 [Spirochaetia bacterium]